MSLFPDGSDGRKKALRTYVWCAVALGVMCVPGIRLHWFFPATLAGAVWFAAYGSLEMDPLRTFRAYPVGPVLVVAGFGLALGGAGVASLLRTDQRHLVVATTQWIAAATGFGTGAAALWGLLSEFVRRRFDERCKKEQQSDRAAIVKQLRMRLQIEEAHLSYLDVARRLEDRADQSESPHTQITGLERRVLNDVRRLAAEVARSLVRVRGALLKAEVLEQLEELAATEAPQSAAQRDLLRQRLVWLAAEVFNRAGPPNIGGAGSHTTAGPARPSDEAARPSLYGMPLPSTAVGRLLRGVVGFDSVVGPRVGAGAALHLAVLSGVALTLHELPAAGIGLAEGLLWSALPIVAFIAGDFWVSRRVPATTGALVVHGLFALALWGIVLKWWYPASMEFPKDGPPTLAVAVLAVIGSLPGWLVGLWLVQRLRPFSTIRPFGQPSRGPERALVATHTEHWQGQWLAEGWMRWLRHASLIWMNEYVMPVLRQVNSQRQIDAIAEVLLAHRAAALEEGADTASLLSAAMAFSGLHAIARWQIAVTLHQELADEEHLDALQQRLSRLWDLENASLRQWKATHAATVGGEPGRGDTIAETYSRFAAERLCPPSREETGDGEPLVRLQA